MTDTRANQPWYERDWGILAIAAAVLVGIAVFAGVTGDADPAPAPPPEPAVSSTSSPSPSPSRRLSLSRCTRSRAETNWRVDLKVLDKACYGTAGCLVDVRPELTYLGIGDLDPGVTYELTYEVVGPLTDPIVKTIEITGEDYEFEEFTVDTSRDGDVDARVVQFEERGF